MIFNGQNARFLHAGGLVALLLLCACARAPETGIASNDGNALPPAILPPSEVADPDAAQSYEVGIASAAADRNRAKEVCAEKSERLKAMCDAEIEAEFAKSESELQDLRGNQQ